MPSPDPSSGVIPDGPRPSRPRASGLPEELLRFLELRRPVSLLLRGAAGTGRSLLAREVLKAVDGPCLILSDEGGREDSRPLGLGADGPITVRGMHELAAGPTLLPAPPTVASAPPVGAPTSGWSGVAVDTWDSLVESVMGQRRRGSMAGPDSERALFGRLAQATKRLVLVAGMGRTTSVEYLVDGIVETVQTHEDDRTERWARFVKLREVELGHSSYPFSLSTGRFHAFPIYPARPPVQNSIRLDPDPTPEQPGLWPGSLDFAAAFGRLMGGTLTLIECDRKTSTDVQLSLITPLLFHSILHAGRLVFVPPPTLFPQEIFERAKGYVPPATLEALLPQLPLKLRILSHATTDVPDPTFGGAVFPLRGSSRQLPIMTTAPESSREYGDGPPLDSPLPRFPGIQEFLHDSSSGRGNLEVVFLAGLVAAAREIQSGYTPEALAAIIQRDLNLPFLHVLMVAPEGEPLIRDLCGLAGTHLRLVSRMGRYLLQGIRPWTENWVLLPADGGSSSDVPFRLVPVT